MVRLIALLLRVLTGFAGFVYEVAWGRCDGEDCEAERARVEDRLWGLDGAASR